MIDNALRQYNRKNHARAIESMQASLDAEIKARTDAMRAKKKYEAQVNDLEMQLDQSNRNLAEQLKLVRKLQAVIKARTCRQCFPATRVT